MSIEQAPTPPPPAPGTRRVFPSWAAAARWPAVWFFIALSIAGVVILGISFGPAIAEAPGAFVLAVVLFAIHGAVFVAIIRAVDWLEPEPRWLFAAAIIWGGFVASANALRANTALESILVKMTSLGFVRDWAAAIEGPTDEEILKTLGIVMIVLLARRQINSILDGVVYGAFVGLGFQEIENITYSLNAIAADGTDSLGPVLQTFVVRGLLAGLWSHTVYSAIAGAGVAYAVLHRERSWFNRIGVALGALALAWLMHFLWNSPAAASLTDYAGTYGVLLVLLIKGLLILGTFLILLHFFRKDEYEGVAGPLESLHNPWIATHNEILALRGWRSRGRARWNAYVYGGLRAHTPRPAAPARPGRSRGRDARQRCGRLPRQDARAATRPVRRARARHHRRRRAPPDHDHGPDLVHPGLRRADQPVLRDPPARHPRVRGGPGPVPATTGRPAAAYRRRARSGVRPGPGGQPDRPGRHADLIAG